MSSESLWTYRNFLLRTYQQPNHYWVTEWSLRNDSKIGGRYEGRKRVLTEENARLAVDEHYERGSNK